MGCTSSVPKRHGGGRKRKRKQSSIRDVAVFVPDLRVPAAVDLAGPLKGILPHDILARMSGLRARIVYLASGDDIATLSAVLELQRALQEYLPVILGLTKQEYRLETVLQFKWKSLGDDSQQTCLASPWYELLSVVHMIAILSLWEANLSLVRKPALDEGERKVTEASKKDVVDMLLKTAGCLDYCIRHILVYLPQQIRKDLPDDLQEGMLEAISTEALAQVVEMQLGLALECEKATLPVKRRLACEAVGYFSQARYCLSGCDTSDGYAKKLLLFIKWKFMEAKAAAYYFHGLVLNKGSGPSDHISAVCCLFAAEELLLESKRASLSFCLAAPVTRIPPVWGIMKHLHKKIPEMAAKKYQMYGYLFDQEKGSQSLPDLPEFPLSLKPDDYNLPDMDALWGSQNCQPQAQRLKEHLRDDGDDDNHDNEEHIEDLDYELHYE